VFRCLGSYCGKPHLPLVLDAGQHTPPDYVGGCAVNAFTRAGDALLSGPHASAVAKPPTRYAWFPIVSPASEKRAAWEHLSLYAGGPDAPLPPALLSLHDAAAARRGDAAYLRDVVEPAFAADASLAPVKVFRDDSFAKPILMPRGEMQLYLEAAHVDALRRPRLKILVYVGAFRANKGQLAFLQKLRPSALRGFGVHFYGTRQPGQEAAWAAVEAAASKLGEHCVVHEERVSHDELMAVMSRASGMIHYSSSDRNPRVLYEALSYGVPLFLTTQSMPYVGLQCTDFVFLTDFTGNAETLEIDLAKFIDYVGKDGQTPAAQIRRTVEAELSAQPVFSSLCQRLGLSAPNCGVDAQAPWYASGTCEPQRILKRYENWLDPESLWHASKRLKAPLGVGGTDWKRRCDRRNARQRRGDAPWWAAATADQIKRRDNQTDCAPPAHPHHHRAPARPLSRVVYT